MLRSGTIGDHGIAVLAAREDLGFETALESDVAPLNGLVSRMLEAGTTHVLRDPSRGGLATALNEIAEQSGVAIELMTLKTTIGGMRLLDMLAGELLPRIC